MSTTIQSAMWPLAQMALVTAIVFLLTVRNDVEVICDELITTAPDVAKTEMFLDCALTYRSLDYAAWAIFAAMFAIAITTLMPIAISVIRMAREDRSAA